MILERLFDAGEKCCGLNVDLNACLAADGEPAPRRGRSVAVDVALVEAHRAAGDVDAAAAGIRGAGVDVAGAEGDGAAFDGEAAPTAAVATRDVQPDEPHRV